MRRKNSGFSSIGLPELIEARDQFHIHLMNKKNVVGTAIGRYPIRREEIDKNGNYKPKPRNQKSERTLDNSIVIDISWPCILVLVKEWEEESDLLDEDGTNILPKTIYMSRSGKAVPICVVKAPKSEIGNTSIDISALQFPTNLIGGGSPLIIHSQGTDFIATAGCLVDDGHKYYALTNKHVIGDAGEIVRTRMGTRLMDIGVSSGKSLNKVSYTKLYPAWQSSNIYVSCDAGLVEVNDLQRWKAEIIGIDRIDEMFDLSTDNFTLDLIAEHQVQGNEVKEALNGNVVGYGAVSRLVKGEIMALFYRYKTVGGIEYVADFLIGGRCGGSLNLHHGDSGMLWLLEGASKEGKKLFQPIALQWGQHEFFVGRMKSKYAFSLSTCLSNVCRELDVDVVRGWNISSDYTWGKLGHYTIGRFAIDAVKDDSLRTFLTNNLDNITLNKEEITPDLEAKDNPKLPKNPADGLCPLSDVPDIIWKQSKSQSWGRKGDENPNHYADADAPTKHGGKTLFDLCSQPSDMKVAVWQAFYNDIDREKIGLSSEDRISQGLICFRVWQIYNYMVDSVVNDQPDRFIFAAGVLSHYIGDCCMPLHSSYMSDGDPADNLTEPYTAKRDSSKHCQGDVYEKVTNPGKGVHVAYEDHMVDDNIDQILGAVDKVLNDPSGRINNEEIDAISSGQTAAFASLLLMKNTQADMSPRSLVEAFKKAKMNQEIISESLYKKFGDSTADCLARGCRYLATVWESAWKDGSNRKRAISNIDKVQPSLLIKLYSDPTQLPSLHLDTIEVELNH
jgi:hypothetical protein